jgi:hypothetical protein
VKKEAKLDSGVSGPHTRTRHTAPSPKKKKEAFLIHRKLWRGEWAHWWLGGWGSAQTLRGRNRKAQVKPNPTNKRAVNQRKLNHQRLGTSLTSRFLLSLSLSLTFFGYFYV